MKLDIAKAEMLGNREEEKYNAIMKEVKMAHPLLNPQVGETVMRSWLQPKLDEFKKNTMTCFEKKLAAAVSRIWAKLYIKAAV